MERRSTSALPARHAVTAARSATEAAEAEAEAAAAVARERRHETASGSAIAERCETSEAYLSQIFNRLPDSKTGKSKSVGPRLARKLELGMGKSVGWMDEPHNAPYDALSARTAIAPGNDTPLLHLAEGQHLVPMLDVRASAGMGELRAEHDPIVGSLRLNSAWVRDRLRSITSIDNLVTLIAYGTSMEPSFRDGSILLVDRGVRAVTIDGVYVLSMENQLYVKRVTRRLPDGALVVTSDNPAYARSVIENGERSQVEVLGRVVWSFDSKGV
jgi:hypothetical protein